MAVETPSPETLARVARSVLTRNLKLRRGERVTIEAWNHTLPWSVAFAREARRIGATPLVLYEDEESYWALVDDHKEAVLGRTAAHEFAALGKTDVYLHMWGPGDRVRLNALSEARREKLFAFNMPWYAAAKKAKLRGARLELGRPYPALAAAYGVDEGTWRDQIIAATAVDPAELARRGAPIAKALSRGRRLHLRDDHGTDLTLGLLHRPARVDDGRSRPADRAFPFGNLINLPSGAVRAPLDTAVADGTIVANRTNYYDDRAASGATFHFSGGRLTEASYEKGGATFDEQFAKGGRGRDRPGFLTIGLNPALHDTPQVEDLELGAVMVSIGGNQRVGGTNASPFFGWAISAGATVEVDGRTVPIGR